MSQSSTPGSEVIHILSALSDGNRFRIVELLSRCEGGLSCGSIAETLDLSRSLLSHHLSVLQRCRIIERRQEGLWTVNSLRRDELARHFAALGRLVEPL